MSDATPTPANFFVHFRMLVGGGFYFVYARSATCPGATFEIARYADGEKDTADDLARRLNIAAGHDVEPEDCTTCDGSSYPARHHIDCPAYEAPR